MGQDDFNAQLAIAAKLNQGIGETMMRNEILKWAIANNDALRRAGVLESLLKVCGQ